MFVDILHAFGVTRLEMKKKLVITCKYSWELLARCEGYGLPFHLDNNYNKSSVTYPRVHYGPEIKYDSTLK